MNVLIKRRAKEGRRRTQLILLGCFLGAFAAFSVFAALCALCLSGKIDAAEENMRMKAHMGKRAHDDCIDK